MKTLAIGMVIHIISTGLQKFLHPLGPRKLLTHAPISIHDWFISALVQVGWSSLEMYVVSTPRQVLTNQQWPFLGGANNFLGPSRCRNCVNQGCNYVISCFTARVIEHMLLTLNKQCKIIICPLVVRFRTKCNMNQMYNSAFHIIMCNLLVILSENVMSWAERNNLAYN